MSDIEVFISASPGETRLALTNDGLLQELVISRDSDRHQSSNIYLGRVEKVMTGLNAAFVQIGEDNAGFLAAPDAQIFDRDREKPKPISELYNEGDIILVQATRDEEDGKGAKLTARISIAGRNLVLTPARPGISVSKSITGDGDRQRLKEVFNGFALDGAGLIIRTHAQNAAESDLRTEAQILCDSWVDMQASPQTMKAPALLHEAPGPILRFLSDNSGAGGWRRIVVDDALLLDQMRESLGEGMADVDNLLSLHQGHEDIFETYELSQQIDDALSPAAPLPGGGEIIIEETAALVAIDVNSGGGSRQGNAESWALAVNLEAAHEAGRQIRLRNLSGQFAIDFLPIKKKENRDAVAEALRQALAPDRGAVNIFGFTRLGLMELTRRRQGKSLTQRLLAPNENQKSAETVAIDAIRSALRELNKNPGRQINIAVGVSILEAFRGVVAPALKIAEKQSGGMITLEGDAALAALDFTVTASQE